MAKLNFHQSSVSHDPSNHSNGPFLQTVMMSFRYLFKTVRYSKQTTNGQTKHGCDTEKRQQDTN